MRVQSLEVEASDEPERRSPIRRVSTARTKLAGSETGAPIQRFMGREQVRKEHGALHEPCPVTPTFQSARRAGWKTGVTIGRPVHGPNARPKLEVEASHEPVGRSAEHCSARCGLNVWTEQCSALRFRGALRDLNRGVLTLILSPHRMRGEDQGEGCLSFSLLNSMAALRTAIEMGLFLR